MNTIYILAGVVAVLIFAYLIYALTRAEDF